MAEAKHRKSAVRSEVGVQVSRPQQWCQVLETKGAGAPGVGAGSRRPGPIRAFLGQFGHPAARAAERVSPPPPLSAGSRSRPARQADAVAIIDRPAICPPIRVRERKQRSKRLSKDCLGKTRTAKSRSTHSSRRRASRDRWSSSTLVALWSNVSGFGMIVLHVSCILASARCPINDAGGSARRVSYLTLQRSF
jgi:hypothetical protein